MSDKQTRRIAKRNARLDEIWEQHNSKINTIIGKLTMARGIYSYHQRSASGLNRPRDLV